MKKYTSIQEAKNTKDKEYTEKVNEVLKKLLNKLTKIIGENK